MPSPVSLHPYRTSTTDLRESLAIQAHLVISAAMDQIHLTHPALHQTLIDEATQGEVHEAPTGLSLADAQADIADMVESYVDTFMPSPDATFCPMDGIDDGIAWWHPNVGVFFDIVVAGALGAESQVLDPELAEAVNTFREKGLLRYPDTFAGIRIVSLDRPDRSLKVPSKGRGVYRLNVTDLDPIHIELGRVTA